tara:strand:- start:130 stop:801 length:672 start_codon:yes stop_codon:yes gene_type:complete
MSGKIGLHLGCGSKYIASTKDMMWINIDHGHKDSVLLDSMSKSEMIDFTKNKSVTLNTYYDRPIQLAKCDKVVCDRYDNIRALDGYREKYFDEIIAFHVLEHFTYKEGLKALGRWDFLLREGGTLRIMVPDIHAICGRLLHPNESEHYLSFEYSCRLLFGSHRRSTFLDGHKSAWGEHTFKHLFSEGRGFQTQIRNCWDTGISSRINPSMYLVIKKGEKIAKA